MIWFIITKRNLHHIINIKIHIIAYNKTQKTFKMSAANDSMDLIFLKIWGILYINMLIKKNNTITVKEQHQIFLLGDRII